ncbi:DUF4097 family beta strand repeat-containing protein [Streptococcus macacae]|uniref:DUF4097 domain-containing protein n=1 Tax=Streptococcus macacae NCTC 11558 TaxID=764298 RepID=G5JY84_9STRE|nr:DUF4097 family beta strand repeat-containing protein [Streptococcus macacae]EHJ51581.1 hypothetical protein STRMA_0144 [Streptococcus macacae NCTC 11558]SUN77998.1 signal peptide [Streptococcus macacae NCTC 11558]
MMKKTLSMFSIIGSVLILSGLLFIYLGLSEGGLKKLQSDNAQKKEIQFKHLQSFSSDLSIKNIEIKKSTSKQFKLTYYQNKKETIAHRLNKKQLSLYQKSHFGIQLIRLNDLINWFYNNNKTNTVILSVPKNTDLKNISMHSSVGNITIKDQKISKIAVKQNTGNFSMTNTHLAHGKIKLNTGNINATKSHLSNIDLITNTGNIFAQNMTISNAVTIDNNTGNIEVSLSAQSAKTTFISAKSDIGRSQISDKLLQGGSLNKNQLKITADTGNIKVK